MRRGRRDVHDELDRVAGDELVGSERPEVVLAGERSGARAVHVGAGDELDRGQPPQTEDVRLADVPAPEQADLHAAKD